MKKSMCGADSWRSPRWVPLPSSSNGGGRPAAGSREQVAQRSDGGVGLLSASRPIPEGDSRKGLLSRLRSHQETAGRDACLDPCGRLMDVGWAGQPRGTNEGARRGPEESDIIYAGRPAEGCGG